MYTNNTIYREVRAFHTNLHICESECVHVMRGGGGCEKKGETNVKTFEKTIKLAVS
jgi:hypothetical protein